MPFPTFKESNDAKASNWLPEGQHLRRQVGRGDHGLERSETLKINRHYLSFFNLKMPLQYRIVNYKVVPC